jgi:signal peptidase II
MKNKTLLKIGFYTIFLILADQLTKYLATVYLKGKNDVILIDKILCLHYLDGGNTGAAWGIFSGKVMMFICFTIIALIVMFFLMKNIFIQYKITNNKYMIVLMFALSTLISGAVGNLIDRIIHGYVIDFIYFNLINFPIFNIADCYVTISCILIVFICLFKIEEEQFSKIISINGK